jgi:hypothetical protein
MLRTYAVLQYWIDEQRRRHRSKSFKKGLEQIALWAATEDQDHRKSFQYGHEIKFKVSDDPEKYETLCIWERIVPSCAAG